MVDVKDLDNVALRNAHVDPERARRFVRLLQDMDAQPCWRRPKYEIEHPFATAQGRAERARVRASLERRR